jgi:Protein of unknown function (DUF3592)
VAPQKSKSQRGASSATGASATGALVGRLSQVGRFGLRVPHTLCGHPLRAGDIFEVCTRVIDLSSETDSEGKVFVHPVVRFTTAEGRTVEFVSASGSSPASHSVGDRVEVLYDPDDPQDAQLSGFFDLWLWPIGFGVLAIGFGAFALFSPGFGLFAGRVPWPGRPF